MTCFCRLFIVCFFIFVSVHFGCHHPDPNGSSDSDTDTDSDSDTDSDTDSSPFNINVELSTEIGTVAIVQWAVNLDSLESAYIEFGPNTDYGMVAPVNLEEPNFRTLLLGMKPSSKYHFRIVASSAADTLTSSDQNIETGPVSNLLPYADIDTPSASELAQGFVVSCFYLESKAFITDADGEYVWWTDANIPPCSRARMSYDGRHMYLRDVNVRDLEGYLMKVSMDGLDKETISVPRSHHDFAVLPDGTIGLICFDDGNPKCDDIKELNPDGTTTQIFHLADAITPPSIEDGCHSNSIHYHEEDDTYTISLLNKHQYVKVTRDGELVWVFGGEESTFKGESWIRQHGHQLLDNGNIVFFNNRELDDNALVLEYSLDESTWQASKVWEWASGNKSEIFGDVRRLPNGNTLVGYSADGVIKEANSKGDLVREMSFNLGGGFGYVMWRESLYGPPPKSPSE